MVAHVVRAFRIRDQKTSFMEACRIRGAPALVIWPKLLDAMFAFGAPKLGWFSVLNDSARMCNESASRTLNSRLTARSIPKLPGARRLLWPAFPKAPGTAVALLAKRLGLRN